jgi:DNA-directed RNA polymerase specialized sigma24 family protein
VIEQTVQHLPPQCRKVFSVEPLRGKTNHEIADEMQILSPRTVEDPHQQGRLHTLRQTLQKLGLISLLLWITG